MPKLALRVAIAACVVLLAFGLTKWLLGPPPGISRENSHRVKKGMTYAELEALFAGPPQGRTDVLPQRLRRNPTPEAAVGQGWVILDWAGEHGRATVFLRDGRVRSAAWHDWGPDEVRWGNAVLPQPEPGPLKRLRRLLGL